MANTSVAGLASITKEAWGSNRLEKQVYTQVPLLEAIQKVKGSVVGGSAKVAVQTGFNNSFTVASSAGGSLNASSTTPVSQATYDLVYNWAQIGIEAGVLNQNTSKSAIIAGLDLEMESTINGMGRQISRQLAGNADGLIAQCGVTTAANVIVLKPASTGGLGSDAIIRGHLAVGQLVDIGTTADSDTIATAVTITAVDETPTAPTITVSGSAVSTTASHYITIANPNSATAVGQELNGLRNITAASGALGNLNPATAGLEQWKGAKVDTTSTVISSSLALSLRSAVFQRTGKSDGVVITGVKQEANYYAMLQNQVRFAGDQGLGLGGVGGLLGTKFNGMGINVMPDIYDKDWFYVTLDDLCRVHGNWDKPMWASDIEGGNGGTRWSQGTTGFVNAVAWAFQVGALRRNSHAAATGLTA